MRLFNLFVATEDGSCRFGAQVMGNLVDNDAVVGQNGFDCCGVACLDGQYHVAWMMEGGKEGGKGGEDRHEKGDRVTVI